MEMAPAREFTSFGYLYLGTGAEDPVRDRATIDTGGLRAIMIVVPDEGSAVQVAQELAAIPVDSIDLCAAFSSETHASVIRAVGPDIPVGRTAYGLEAVRALATFQD
jgi:Family of unknown function (DUF6506)